MNHKAHIIYIGNRLGKSYNRPTCGSNSILKIFASAMLAAASFSTVAAEETNVANIGAINFSKENIITITEGLTATAEQNIATSTKSVASRGAGGAWRPVGFKNVEVSGELSSRVLMNMARLEQERYQPQNVFLTEEQSGYWPGDTEGRTILGLVCDAQASHSEAKYLDEIIRLIPEHLNERGYFGTIHKDSLDEQQLSGNGWVLRGLCEYYRWKGDRSVLPIINGIAENLFVAGKDLMSSYPVNPSARNDASGGASGHVSETIGRWRLSTDVGCVFIGMDGLIHAYEVTGNKKLRPVIESLIDLFLSVDLISIKAQTHATLTALRGLLRYAAITGQKRYIDEAATRWTLYKKYGMTENYANYNWFCRYDTWTEPCAIVDSYIVASQLWQQTGRGEYRDDAELIYYNAICHGQRANGGFGTDKCPGNGYTHPYIAVSDYEAWWCCTMRGGEGLGRAVEYAAFGREGELALPFYRNAVVAMPVRGDEEFRVQETTNYPFGNGVSLRIVSAPRREMKLSLACAEWMDGFKVTVNGQAVDATAREGMATLVRKFSAGDRVEISFTMAPRVVKTLNRDNTRSENVKVLCGPLLLAAPDACPDGIPQAAGFEPLGARMYRVAGSNVVLSPLYHLMEAGVSNDAPAPYQRRIIF